MVDVGERLRFSMSITGGVLLWTITMTDGGVAIEQWVAHEYHGSHNCSDVPSSSGEMSALPEQPNMIANPRPCAQTWLEGV